MQEKIPQLIPLTELRRHAGAVMGKLSDERPLIVTSNGNPIAVVLSWYAWQRIVEAQ